MDIEKRDADYNLKFYTSEVTTMRAAYNEDIAVSVDRGNEITGDEKTIAGWSKKSTHASITVTAPRTVIETLHAFQERTKQAAGEIPALIGTPPFVSSELIRKRYDLGAAALTLANDMEEKLEEADQAYAERGLEQTLKGLQRAFEQVESASSDELPPNSD